MRSEIESVEFAVSYNVIIGESHHHSVLPNLTATLFSNMKPNQRTIHRALHNLYEIELLFRWLRASEAARIKAYSITPLNRLLCTDIK